ncbi:MAG: Hsp70 family protein [Rhodothermales bacterium]|nr:Hsp70 family protein [Rhodothermales bacterium]
MPDLPAPDDLAHRYAIGIDLGTTNSAVAYVDLKQTPRRLRIFEVPQLVEAGEVAARPVLPSFLYLPGGYDLPEGSTALPWAAERDYVVGTFAREQGARVPGRLVASAKSWLSHAGVDRTADILPWGADDALPKVSPVEASTRYLRHVREAWDARVAKGRDGRRFEEQLVILTVPASFDEVARELTVAAARAAGLGHAILVEEPLAAFYAWLHDHEDAWQEQMDDGQLILVCDVGGGTTDFSIIGVREGEAGLRFDRLAVGEHLMLGGDNMDHALARHLEARMTGTPGRLDAARWHQLVHRARQAKETLLAEAAAPDAVDVAIVGTAGRLIADTLSTSLEKDEVRSLLLDGFFPGVDLADYSAPRAGLSELGLPYEKDPAVTRHLATFWQRFAGFVQAEMGRAAPFPDFVLYNGGTLAPAPIRRRLTETLGGWFADAAGDGWTPEELDNPRPDLAVAKGAAYYGMVRMGEGVRVGSGSPRAYYVGVEAGAEEAGAEAHPAVCLVPRGTEEGFAARLEETAFIALTNEPVAFQVYSSSTRLGDRLGDVVALPAEEASALPPIRTVLRYGKKGVAQRLPVQLGVHLTEVGTLELWCHAEETDHRGQLRFDVRRQTASDEPAQVVEETIDESLIGAAEDLIRKTFARVDKHHRPEPLRRRLEDALDRPRHRWTVPLLRRLADAFLAVFDGRKLSPQHEERWLNLFGYCLRPGYGDPADELRMKQAWRLYFEGIANHRETRCRSEFWLLWRRTAGGLSAGQQQTLYQEARPVLADPKKRKTGRLFPERLGTKEELELWMALAACERLPANAKTDLGRLLLKKLDGAPPQPQELWALSRLGARTAMYGPLDRLVPADEAARWLDGLLAMDLDPADNTAHALVHLARRTGDRARDLPEDTRRRVAAWLERLDHGARYTAMLDDPESALEHDEQDWIFGEALPAGLVLAEDVGA